MAQVKKYEFPSKELAKQYINELWIGEGEERVRKEPYYAHVVEIGFISSGGEWDEDGNVIVEPIISDKYSVDVLWESEIEERWNEYEIEVEGFGVHKFL